MKDYKPTVVFDFDGVIHSYRSGWKGPGITPDPVVPGIAEAIEELRAGGYRVIVVSTRCADPEGKAAVESYLTANGILVTVSWRRSRRQCAMWMTGPSASTETHRRWRAR